MAPPSISRRISDLEGVLGVRLLNRSTRKLSLTAAGEIYFERARIAIRTVEEANLAVTEERGTPSGVLRITVPSALTRLHIAPAVAAFQADNPKVQIVMRVTDRIVDVIGDGLDVAIRVGRLDDSSLIARKLGAARRAVCASQVYLDREGRPEHPNDLAQHACLTFRGHPGSNVWRFRKGDEQFEILATGPCFSDDAETLLAWACAGAGLICVPEWVCGVELGSGRLVEVLTDYTADPADTPIHAVYAPGPYVAPKIRAFVEFLVSKYSGNYDWRTPH